MPMVEVGMARFKRAEANSRFTALLEAIAWLKHAPAHPSMPLCQIDSYAGEL
jgi:hypothetical protein